MTTQDKPVVSVGLPVFNGEALVGRAIESVLAQDFDRFELIISDNASSDRTEAICREYARSDPRIRYIRQPENLGAVPNFNSVLEHARGDFFKWAAHDDWCHPTFLTRCLEVLQAEPDTVLCYSTMGVVNDRAAVFRVHRNHLPRTSSSDPRRRFHDVLWSLRDPTAPVFGLMRTAALRSTAGIRNCPEPDRVLLAELSLYGRFRHLNEVLYFHYGPPGHLWHYGPSDIPRRRRSWVWLDARNIARPKLGTIRILQHHLDGLRRAQLGWLVTTTCMADLLTATAWVRPRGKIRSLIARSRARRREFRPS